MSLIMRIIFFIVLLVPALATKTQLWSETTLISKDSKIPPYHDAEIAMVTDDDRTSICEAYTINKLFFECVLAAPPNLQTRAIKNQAAAAGADAEAGPPEDD